MFNFDGLLKQFISLCFIAFACTFLIHTKADAEDIKEPLQAFMTKCKALKSDSFKTKGQEKAAYVIWGVQSDRIYPCSNSDKKSKKLIKVLGSLGVDTAVKAEFLRFRGDGLIKDHNLPITRSVAKVKKGQSLTALKAYDTSGDYRRIFGKAIDPDTNSVVSDGYIFIPNPDNYIKKSCVLKVISDGIGIIESPKRRLKKNCIFKTLPIQFSLVPVTKVHYPVLSIGAKEAIEGQPLEFEVTKKGKQSLSTPAVSFTYEISPKTASKDDFSVKSKERTLTFEPGKDVSQIYIRTIDDDKFEEDEKLTVNIIDAVNARIKSGSAQGIIKNDDFKPIVSVTDAQGSEGETLEFRVTRQNPESKVPFSLRYTFDDQSASDEDFDAAPNVLEFTENEATRIIEVKTFHDELKERIETFTLTLQPADDIELARPIATGTIKNIITCQNGAKAESFAACPKVTKTCSDGSEVDSSVDCRPDEKTCPDGSIVSSSAPCPITPDKIECWDGSEVANIEDCSICTIKPEITEVLFPTIGGEQFIQIKGKGCPGQFVSFGVNEAFETPHQVQVQTDGSFSLTVKRQDFYPDAMFLNIHVASLDFRLEDSDFRIIPDSIVIGNSRGIIPPRGNCRGIEVLPLPIEDSIEKDEYLVIDYYNVIERNGECALDVSGKAEANGSATLKYSYNPQGQLSVDADSTGVWYTEKVIPELLLQTQKVLKIRLGISGQNGKAGNLRNMDKWAIEHLASVLKIYYKLGMMSEATPRPARLPYSNTLNLANVTDEARISKPFYFHQPRLDESQILKIRTMIERDLAVGKDLKGHLNGVLNNLVKGNYRNKKIKRADLSFVNLVNPKSKSNPKKELFSYHPNQTSGSLEHISPSKTMNFGNGEFELRVRNFNEVVDIPSIAIIDFVTCSAASDSDCSEFSVELPTILTTEKSPFCYKCIPEYIALILTILTGAGSLITGTSHWLTGRGLSKLFGNRREIYLAMIDAYPQTSSLNADAVNAWGYTNADVNDQYALKKQAGKILDFVYSKRNEEDIVNNLIASNPNNVKCKKLARHLPEAAST